MGQTREYSAVRSIAFLIITVYPLLVPLVFFSLLWHVHDVILAGKRTRLTRGLFFLHGPCKFRSAHSLGLERVPTSNVCGTEWFKEPLLYARR